MYGLLFIKCLLLVVPMTLPILVTASSIPDTRDNITESGGGDSAEGADRPLKQEMTQLRNELLEALREGLGQLREEVNAKTAIAGSAGSGLYMPPHHLHHYHHHHRRPTLNQDEDAGVTEELSALREILRVFEDRLQATEMQDTESKPRSCEDKLVATQERLESAERKLALVDDTISNTDALSVTVRNQGSTFVRWGRTQCPNNTQLVYSGAAGGSKYQDKGGAANRLCLTMEPEFDETVPSSHHTYLQGAEYDNIAGHHDHDVPCSVCRAPQSTTIMVPATLTCPTGWVTQYTGHLVAGHYRHDASSEYQCLDREQERMPGGQENKDAAQYVQVVTACGSLPCPPYVAGKVVTCVVCSM